MKNIPFRSLLPFLIGGGVALICLILAYPLSLWLFYPIVPAVLPVWLLPAVLCPILWFRTGKRVFRVISFVLFSIPVLAEILLLTALGAGWVVMQ